MLYVVYVTNQISCLVKDMFLIISRDFPSVKFDLLRVASSENLYLRGGVSSKGRSLSFSCSREKVRWNSAYLRWFKSLSLENCLTSAFFHDFIDQTV